MKILDSEQTEIIREFLSKTASPPPLMDDEDIFRFVDSCLEYRGTLATLSEAYGSPLYVVSEGAVRYQARKIRKAFEKEFDLLSVFYAVKSNNMPEILKIFIDEGINADCSSGVELDLALNLGAKKVLFSGPGKTDEELKAALMNNDRVVLLIDSFGELRALDAITKSLKKDIQTGVRINTDGQGLWQKFGIPLGKLQDFISESKKYPHIHLKGIQFHSSWNLTPEPHKNIIRSLGEEIGRIPGHLLSEIEFLDIGGGFWPEDGEWLRTMGINHGQLFDLLPEYRKKRFYLPAPSIETFSLEISKALNDFIPPGVRRELYMEPGRWLCHNAVHLLLRVTDLKSDGLAITDGGTNAVGWERFEHDYFPVINLTHPSRTERSCNILGSLCTPHDVWGYSYHGSRIEKGDLLLIPNQGAYTYSLRQEFIKPLPRVVIVKDKILFDFNGN